jgi:chemotaxis protein methyltransferase CheR
VFASLLDYLTVQVSEMFRDPTYFRALREKVVPLLRTYPSLKIWVAGCSTGEEAYSIAILLQEEGLLARALIYATDINPHTLLKAETGVYDAVRIPGFTVNHRESGARTSLSDYYTAAYGRAVFNKSLRDHIVFSDHSLATDSVFAEVQLVSCRNVLIYFNRDLQNRALGLFRDSLCRQGFLGLGSKETLRFSSHEHEFDPFVPKERIYQKSKER